MNAVFQNFGVQPFGSGIVIPADAVFAWNDQQTILTTTNFRGMNKLAVNPAGYFTFSSCYYDIRTIGTHLSATECTSNNPVYSIYCEQFPYSSGGGITQPPISYKIKDNVINGFRFRGIRLGIHKQADIGIEGNKITDIDAPSDILSPRIGVFLEKVSLGLLDLTGTNIQTNSITSSSMFPYGVFYGIALRRVFGVNIANNFISDNLPASDLQNFQGIRVSQPPCDGLNITYNQVSGARIDYPVEGIGMFIDESVDCTIFCNTLDNMNTGIRFRRDCSMPNKLGKNNFNRHAIGLQLGDPINPVTSIGEQGSMENRWFGAASTVEAMAVNLPSAQSSIFKINSSDQGSEYWPNPRLIGATNDIGQWFTQEPNQEPSSDNACYPRRPYLSDSDRGLLNGTYVSPFGYPALDWEAKWKFANRLNSDEELRGLTTDVAQYYGDTYDETYSRLSRAYQAYINRWFTYPTIDQLTEAHAAVIEDRFELDNLLTGGDNTAIHAQMLSLDESIINMTTAFGNESAAWASNVGQSMANLLDEVEEIPCSDEYEEDMRTVLSVLIRSHATRDIPTEGEMDLMKQIANKCRYSGGYAVVLARSFFEPQDTYPQDLSCHNEDREQMGDMSKEGGVMLFPNPAGNSVRLGIGKPFTQGTLRLFNGQGALVMEWMVSEQFTLVPLEAVLGGLYLAIISLDGEVYASRTFIKH